jgi:hypothetical protein
MPSAPRFDAQDVGHTADESAYLRGEAYCFEQVAFAHGCTGLIDGPAPVVVMLEEMRGIAMTRESARALITELQACLDAPDHCTCPEPTSHEH